MGRILVLLILLLSINAHALVPSGVPQVSFGSANTNLGGLVVQDTNPGAWFGITASTNNGGNTANHYSPFYKNGTLYQVSSGKTATCIDMQYFSSGGGGHFQLMSATATFANNASSVTGGVLQTGTAGNYSYAAVTVDVYYTSEMSYNFTQNTWPGFNNANTNTISVSLVCQEN